MVPFPNHASLIEIERRTFDQRFFQLAMHVGQLIQLLPKLPQTARLNASNQRAERGQRSQGISQGCQVPWGGCPHRDFAQQPLQIVDRGNLLGDPDPCHRLLEQLLDRVQAGLHHGLAERRPQHPGPQQAGPHGGCRPVYDRQQGGLRLPGEKRLHQFQVADSDRIEHHPLLPVVKADTVQVGQRALLRLLQIMQQRAAGTNGLRLVFQPESIERMHMEVIREHPQGVFIAKDPFIEVGTGKARGGGQGFRKSQPPLRLREQRLARRGEQLARSQMTELLGQLCFPAGASHLRRAKLSGGEIHAGQADPLPGPAGGDQVVVLARREEAGVGGRAGRDHPGDFAPHQFFREARVLHLLANSHLVAFLDQARDVGVGGVVRNPAHGHSHSLFLAAGRQSNLEFAGGQDSVFKKEFVKISQTEKQQRLRILLLDGIVLPHQRRRGFRHLGPARQGVGDTRARA